MIAERQFKVLKAEDADLSNLPVPGLLSTKLDGIRSYNRTGEVLSSTNKLVPNKAIRKRFEHCLELDGEFVVGDPTAEDAYNKTYSKTSTVNGDAEDVKFYVFDSLRELRAPYIERMQAYQETVASLGDDCVIALPQYQVDSEGQVMEWEALWLGQGFEGAMLRKSDAPYKFGRSTLREAILLKIKRFDSAECRVLRFVEAMQNTNEAKTDEMGRSKRSSHQEGLVGKNTLGAIVVVGINGRFKDVEFNCGFAKGFPHAARKEMWDNPDKYIDKVGTYRFFPIGCKDAPRFPQWSGLRDIGEVDVNR